MKNLFKSDYKILGTEIFEKDTKDGKKTYYTVKLYIEFSEVIITCFIDKATFEKIQNKNINDTNIIEHLNFKIDKDMKCHIFIK